MSVVKKKNVVYVVEDLKSAQFRYRVYNVEQSLENNKKWCLKHYRKGEFDKIEASLCDAKILVIERQSAKDNSILKIIDLAKKRKIKVLFDLDDLVFDYRDLLLLMRTTNSRNILYWLGYFWGIRRIAKRVDGFLCTNEFLGKKLERSFKKPYKVIPNYLNMEQVELSERLLAKKGHRDFWVGYFSGSPTHTKDFRLVESDLIKFLNKHDDARIMVVGYMDFSLKMKEMMKIGKVKAVKAVDYLKLQELIAKVDVNIAPLEINDFTNCKSELKFFEAAIVKTTTVASPTYSFLHAIQDGKNGFLAKPGEWYEKMDLLYCDPELNKKVADNAKKDVLKKFFGEKIEKNIEEAYDYFAA